MLHKKALKKCCLDRIQAQQPRNSLIPKNLNKSLSNCEGLQVNDTTSII